MQRFFWLTILILVLSVSFAYGQSGRAAQQYNRALEQQQSGDLQGALAGYDKVIEIDP